MKRLCVVLALLALSIPAFAADIAKNDTYVEGVPTVHENQLGRGDALVASYIQGTFTDTGVYYQAALDANGMPADIIFDPNGVWPSLGSYCLVVGVTNDMWWTYSYWAQDDAVLSAYMTAGGTCIFEGQDYIWSRPMGISGFPATWLGVCGDNQDLNWDALILNYEGEPGGPIDGLTGTITPCYAANNFFTDEVIPCEQGFELWTSDQITFPTEGSDFSEPSLFCRSPQIRAGTFNRVRASRTHCGAIH